MTASATTKFGISEATKTTSDSAASRSRNNHITQVKKAVAVGWRLMSQYDTMENSIEIKTGDQTSTRCSKHGSVDTSFGLTQIWQPDDKVGDKEGGRTV